MPPLPTPTPVLAWDTYGSVETNLRAITAHRARYMEYLKEGIVEIDEAAILCPNRTQTKEVVSVLTGAGWEHFNSSDDEVFTNPFSTIYTVHYEFLRHPEFPYRMEVMCPGDKPHGFSPLHAALWRPAGAPTSGRVRYLPIPHLSFKVEGIRGYSMAVRHLKDQGLIPTQTCQSTYGVFGYYLPHDATHQIYLKPRANLRDREVGEARPVVIKRLPAQVLAEAGKGPEVTQTWQTKGEFAS